MHTLKQILIYVRIIIAVHTYIYTFKQIQGHPEIHNYYKDLPDYKVANITESVTQYTKVCRTY